MDTNKPNENKTDKINENPNENKAPETAAAEAPEKELEETASVKTFQDYLDAIEASITSVKHFKSGKVDEYGHVVGVREYQPGMVPHAHQDHHYDSFGRVVKLSIYELDFSKPRIRLYFYEGESDKLSESVWLDRYGKIDNIHRYRYDLNTGLMADRAEYNKEGEIFYLIHSDYNYTVTPPRLVKDTWKDKKGKNLQRYSYKYDLKGEMSVEEHYDKDDNLIGYFHFKYDERSNLSRKEWYGPDKVLRSYFEYESDANDRTVKVTLYDGSGKKESSQEFKYDNIGNVIEEAFLDGKDKVFKRTRY